MEQLVFLLIIGVIALARWWVESANRKAQEEKQRQQQQQPPSETSSGAPPPRRVVVPTARRTPAAGNTAEEERVRKFLEALGVPTAQAPPPKVEPRPPRPLPEMVRETIEKTQQKRDIFEPLKEARRHLPPLTTFPPPPPRPEQAVPPLPPQVEQAPPRVPVTVDIPTFENVEVKLARPTVGGVRRKALEESEFPDTTARQARRPEITKLLRSRGGLREAVLLREILGPPKGLSNQTELASI